MNSIFSVHFLIETALYLIFAVPLSVMDVRRFRISLIYTFTGCAAFLAFRLSGNFSSSDGFQIWKAVKMLELCGASLLSSVVILYAARIFSGNGLGKGDIIFGAFTSFYCLFWTNIAGIVFSAVSGLLFYLLLAVFKRKDDEKILRPVFAVPFVPFITFGAVLARIFFG